MARPPDQRPNARLSASQLADYLVAPTPIGQMGILRQAKNPGPNRPMIIQYQHAKRAIAECLRNRGAMNRIAAQAILDLERRRDSVDSSPLVRDDAQRSIDVIEQFQRSANALEIWQSEYEEPPARPAPLNINGVEISVYPDVLALAQVRGDNRVGQVFIRCTIGQSGEPAENRRVEANNYLATIAHIHATHYLEHRGNPYAPSSFVLDVPRRRVTRAPANNARRISNIEMACTMIAALWPTI